MITVYFLVALIAFLLYNYIPVDKNPIKSPLLFTIMAVLLSHFILNTECFAIRERFTDAMGTVLSSQKQAELAKLEEKLNKIKEESMKEFNKALMEMPEEPVQKPVEVAKDSCDCESKIEKVLDKYIKKGKYIDDRGMVQNIADGDMMYNQLNPEQMQPLGTYDKTFTNKWNHGFTYLDTSKWSVPAQRAPVCKAEKTCPVCPVTTSGYPLNVLDYDTARKVMPPDNINVDYINDKLNKSV